MVWSRNSINNWRELRKKTTVFSGIPERWKTVWLNSLKKNNTDRWILLHFSSIFLLFFTVGGYIPTYTNKGIHKVLLIWSLWRIRGKKSTLSHSMEKKNCLNSNSCKKMKFFKTHGSKKILFCTIVVANKIRPLSSFSKQFYLTLTMLDYDGLEECGC